ncbi:MAG: hypothetical protein JRN15_11545 [Nitrososphaerota archaeon]|nr:hypothetical protein [Nitrososphaerota archaeon]
MQVAGTELFLALEISYGSLSSGHPDERKRSRRLHSVSDEGSRSVDGRGVDLRGSP